MPVTLDTKMTPAELVVAREYLGITGPWLAEVAHVASRTQRRWEAGDSEIPTPVEELVRELADTAADTVDRLVADLLKQKKPGVVLLRTDADYQAAAPAGRRIAYPARWHHHVAARASIEVPAVILAFAGEKAPAGDWIRPVVAAKRVGAGLGQAVYTTVQMDYPSWQGRQ